MYSEQVQTEQKPTPAEEAIVTAPVEAERPDVTPEGEQTPEAQKLVPLAALHEERQTRKQLQTEMRQLREAQQFAAQQQAQRDQDYQIAQQRLAQMIAARDRPPEPTEEEDPLAYTANIARQTQAEVQALRQQQWQQQQAQQQQQQEWAQRSQQEQQMQQLVTLTTQREAEFATKTPDYNEAIMYAKTRRAKELIAAGYEPEAAADFAQREGWQLAHQWLSQGMNPAERGYALAQAMGYQPKTVDDETRAEMREQGMRATKTSGGGTVRGRITAAQVASMSPTQLARMSDEDFKAAMGG